MFSLAVSARAGALPLGDAGAKSSSKPPSSLADSESSSCSSSEMGGNSLLNAENAFEASLGLVSAGDCMLANALSKSALALACWSMAAKGSVSILDELTGATADPLDNLAAADGCTGLFGVSEPKPGPVVTVSTENTEMPAPESGSGPASSRVRVKGGDV